MNKKETLEKMLEILEIKNEVFNNDFVKVKSTCINEETSEVEVEFYVLDRNGEPLEDYTIKYFFGIKNNNLN